MTTTKDAGHYAGARFLQPSTNRRQRAAKPRGSIRLYNGQPSITQYATL